MSANTEWVCQVGKQGLVRVTTFPPWERWWGDGAADVQKKERDPSSAPSIICPEPLQKKWQTVHKNLGQAPTSSHQNVVPELKVPPGLPHPHTRLGGSFFQKYHPFSCPTEQIPQIPHPWPHPWPPSPSFHSAHQTLHSHFLLRISNKNNSFLRLGPSFTHGFWVNE